MTGYGNHYLKNGEIPTDFDSINKTFNFCNRVYFREWGSQLEKVFANSPTEWFDYLKVMECKHLRLYFLPTEDQSLAKDHQLTGFVGGGGTWFIEAIYDNYSYYWGNRWEVTNQNAEDQKIWTVSYGTSPYQLETSDLQIDNQLIKNKLKQTLSEISDFAFKQNLQDWGKQFERAKGMLDNNSPEESYWHKDLIPYENYSLIAKQILFSADLAWVFGGMGSWNDLGFDSEKDNETYDRLSEQLYSNIIEAIIGGVNTF